MTLRDLPSVDRLVGSLPDALPRALRVTLAREAIDEARARIAGGGSADARAMAESAAEVLLRHRPTEVINATGVLLHTNLGRAPLHPAAADAARVAASASTNLEIDLDSGRRGGRAAYLRSLLRALTGAEAAMAVNNNAGGLFLALAALAADGPVPVSRGELIEIGGSYRLPELMAASGARLVEVGTTNRTRIADYREAVDAGAAMLLKVHPSNYRIAGFSEETPLSDLAELARERAIPLVFDAGSGLLDERVPWWPGPPPSWLEGEPGVVQSLERGADLVLFSGDKLLGGPQAGIVVGSADLVARMAAHPVARAMRLDGPTLAALTVTLEHYADGRGGEIPFWHAAALSPGDLAARCRTVVETASIAAEVVDGASTVGAGSVPGSEIPGPVITWHGDADTAYLRLLDGPRPVVARRDRGRLVVDLRTVDPARDGDVADALSRACRS